MPCSCCRQVSGFKRVPQVGQVGVKLRRYASSTCGAASSQACSTSRECPRSPERTATPTATCATRHNGIPDEPLEILSDQLVAPTNSRSKNLEIWCFDPSRFIILSGEFPPCKGKPSTFSTQGFLPREFLTCYVNR